MADVDLAPRFSLIGAQRQPERAGDPSLWRATTSESREPTELGGGLRDEGAHGHDQAHLHIARWRSATSGRGAMGAIPSLWWGMLLTVPFHEEGWCTQ